jgi:uncharacterized membrane protein YqaE (UPF0057 family)
LGTPERFAAFSREPVHGRLTTLRSESAMAMDLIRILLAVLLPPLGVFLQVGLGGQFWLNILLTLLGYIPGIVHAVWIIARR